MPGYCVLGMETRDARVGRVQLSLLNKISWVQRWEQKVEEAVLKNSYK